MTEVLLEYRETGREAWRENGTAEGVGGNFSCKLQPCSLSPPYRAYLETHSLAVGKPFPGWGCGSVTAAGPDCTSPEPLWCMLAEFLRKDVST